MSLYFLIGMPGSGKTYWGKKIAAHYKLRFTDLDEYIEQREQEDIATIFLTEGEKIFRQKEHQYLNKIIQRSTGDEVIACGGGTPCFYNNMEIMLEHGTVIYLDATIETLIKNINQNLCVRPLISGKKDIKDYLVGLLQERKSVYEKAMIILQTKDDLLVNFSQIIKG